MAARMRNIGPAAADIAGHGGVDIQRHWALLPRSKAVALMTWPLWQ
jgi:hypothetical protein